MARTTAEAKRLQVLRDFYWYFEHLEPLAQQGIIDNLMIQRDLCARRQRPQAAADTVVNGADLEFDDARG